MALSISITSLKKQIDLRRAIVSVSVSVAITTSDFSWFFFLAMFSKRWFLQKTHLLFFLKQHHFFFTGPMSICSLCWGFIQMVEILDHLIERESSLAIIVANASQDLGVGGSHAVLLVEKRSRSTPQVRRTGWRAWRKREERR